MVRLTIRATDENVPPVLLKLMHERIAAGSSGTAETHAAPTSYEISQTFGSIMVPADVD